MRITTHRLMRFGRVLYNNGPVFLNSKEEISKALAKQQWRADQLLTSGNISTNESRASSPSSHVDESVTPELLDKLLKQSGLNPAEDGSPRQKALLSELSKQLSFVEHISEVNTEGIQPLIRLGAMVQDLSFETISTPIDTESNPLPTWKPSDLASQKNGEFYIVKEGLRKE